jgi:hypothetical protein
VLKQYGRKAYREIIVMTDSVPLKKKLDAFEKAIKQSLSSMLPVGTIYRVMRLTTLAGEPHGLLSSGRDL